ncbi:MAG: HAMP domain-containing protein, partial [Thermoanaerobacteraceae bacterium]|nr:HAMP domain-containing protein [Thermoanaerobacteraceae bacterium]
MPLAGSDRSHQRTGSLRWRLGISFALLGLVVTALLTGIAVNTITTISLSNQKEDAISAVEGAATAFTDAIYKSTADPAQSAHQLGLAAGGRVIWLGPEGVVRVDGEGDTGLAGQYLKLPKELIDEDSSAAQIYTSGNRWTVYATVPLKIANRPAGRLLLVRDLEGVKCEFYELRGRLWGAGTLLALIFTFIGFLVAKSLAQPLEIITKAAQDMEAGNLKQSVSVEGSYEIVSLGKAFNDMAKRVADLDRQRRAFVADAAHELRTPLASLKALAEGMGGNEEELQGFIRQIDRLTRLVNNLLTL